MTRAPLRIAFATDWFLPRLGGIELHLAELASRLVTEGHQVSVLTSTPGADAPAGVMLVPLDVVRLPVVDVAASPGLLALLEQRLREGRYDVVHAHVSVVSPVAFGAVVAARRLGMPVVVTFHSMLHAGALALRVADWMLRWSDWPVVLSAVSGTVAAQVAAGLRRDGAVVRVLPNGIDPDPWRRAAEVRPHESGGPACTFVSTMRLHRKKRPAALLRAFARARELAPRVTLRLVIIGDGPQRALLGRLAARLGIASVVERTGRLSRADIARMYADAHVFVSATLHESFGIAALEARAAGLPVVAMQQSGATEFLVHGLNSLLAGSDEELAAHLAVLAADSAFRARLGAHAGDVESFTWDAVLRRHHAAYAEAIGLSAGGRE